MTPALGAGGGSMSNLSFVRQPDGTLSMRERKGGRKVDSAPQRGRESACRQMVRAWQTMRDDERDAWERYSEELHALGATPSLSRPRPGYRVFSQLGLKALQVRPEGPVPVAPPSAPFFGDGARVKAAFVARASCSGVIHHAQEDADHPERDESRRYGEGDEGEAGVLFTCLVPNSPGVATELLVQTLPSPGRKGSADKYRSRGFVEFAAPGQEAFVVLPLGTSLVAVRFVEIASGGSSGIVPLGRVSVGS